MAGDGGTEMETNLFPEGEEPFSLDDIARLSAGLIDAVAAGKKKPEEAKQEQQKLINEAIGFHHLIEGIRNKRWFAEKLTEETNRSRRYGSRLTIITADLDGFKAVNDELGHQAGDKTLIAVGAILRNMARRRIDTVAGLGGDEFAILLPEIDSMHGLVVAVRILKAIPSVSPLDPKTGMVIPVTTSIGVAEFFNDETAESFFERGDQALKQAKLGGKNSIALDIGNRVEFDLTQLETIISQNVNIQPGTKAQTIKDIIAHTILVHT